MSFRLVGHKPSQCLARRTLWGHPLGTGHFSLQWTGDGILEMKWGVGNRETFLVRDWEANCLPAEVVGPSDAVAIETAAFFAQGHKTATKPGASVDLSVASPGGPVTATGWNRPVYAAKVAHLALPQKHTVLWPSLPPPLTLSRLPGVPHGFNPLPYGHDALEVQHMHSLVASLLREFWPATLGCGPVDAARMVRVVPERDGTTSVHVRPRSAHKLSPWVVHLLWCYACMDAVLA